MMLFDNFLKSVTCCGLFSHTKFIFSPWHLISSYACSVTQLCPTLCDPMDCSPPCSSVQGISQVRKLKWVAISYSRRPSQPKDQTTVSYISCIGRWALYHCVIWETIWSLAHSWVAGLHSDLGFMLKIFYSFS